MNYELLSYLLKAGLVLAVLTSAYAWLVKRETFLQVNRWLLWINVAATLLLPIIPLPDFEWLPDAPSKVVAEVIPLKKPLPAPTIKEENPLALSIPAAPSATSAARNETPQASSLSFWDWVGWIYVLVAGLLTLKLFIQLGVLWQLKRNGKNYATDYKVQLIENTKITAPFSFFYWIFYNPTQHSDDEWEQIWAHECIHAHQLHSVDMLTAEILKIGFWFNPFAWWHQRLVQETLEFITDRAVLESGVEKKSYQYHLLRTTLTTDQQTLGNHFNKSLLKTRIEMMNKTKTRWKGIGKYFAFVGMLWLCAAFTKPYRAKIAAKVVAKVPELKAILESETPVKTDSSRTEQAPKNGPTSKTKYVIYKGDKLFWVITPKVTFKDLEAIQQEFKKAGGVFFVKQMKYDPLGFYLTEISIQTSYLKSGGGCATDDLKEIDKPIAAFGGWIDAKKGTCGISDNSHDPVFAAIAEQDKKVVEKWINDHAADYNKSKKEEKRREDEALLDEIRYKYYRNPLRAANGFTQFGQEALQYIFQACARNRIYFENEGALRVENLYKDAAFSIDNQASTLQEAELLTFDKIRTVVCYVVYTDSTRQAAQRTVAIITHNYKP